MNNKIIKFKLNTKFYIITYFFSFLKLNVARIKFTIILVFIIRRKAIFPIFLKYYGSYFWRITLKLNQYEAK